MPKATNNGKLNKLDDNKFYILIPKNGGLPERKISFYVLPEISDSKSAVYADESIMGRSMPLKTYSYSDNRSIGVNIHFLVTSQKDISENITAMRSLQSCVYPGEEGNFPFTPPPVCKIKFGDILGSKPLCCVLKSYSVKFPTEVAWDATYFIPYKFDMDTNWDVVYNSMDLPSSTRILQFGV